MILRIGKLKRQPLLIYLLVFLSSISNSVIYLTFNRTVWFEYILLGIAGLEFLWLTIKSIHANRLGKNTKYIIFLLTYVFMQSIFFTIFFADNVLEFLPRNLFTALISVFVFLVGIKTYKQFITSIWIFMIGAFLATMIPMILYPNMIGIRSTYELSDIFWGGFWNPVLILFVSAGWLSIAQMHREDRNLNRIVLVSLFLLTWLGGMFGLSRTLLLITLVSIIAYALFARKMKYFFNISIILVFVSIFLYFFFGEFIQHFIDIISSKSISEDSRLLIWQEYLSKFREYALFGATTYYRDYSSSGAGPHSVFLNWLVQFGIIGLSLFLYLLFGVYKSIKTVYKKSRIQGSALIAWFVSYLILVSINQTGFVTHSIFISIAIILKWSKYDSYYDQERKVETFD